MLKGIDISHWNNDRGAIYWDEIKRAGYEFVFIKLTGGYGGGFVDPAHKENVHNALRHSFIVGGYHFARFQNKDQAKSEAEFFGKHAVKFDLDFVILDIEHPEAEGDLTSPASVFIEEISDIAQPLVYSYPAWISKHFNRDITEYPLWIAHYGVQSPDIKPWSDWRVWQYSATASVPGLSGDVDVNWMKPDVLKEKHGNSNKKSKHDKEPTDVYTIQRGDTFWDLEERWNIQHGTLQVLNPNINPRQLQVGQKIHVPTGVLDFEKKVSKGALKKAVVPYPGHLFVVKHPYIHGEDVKRIQRALNNAVGEQIVEVDGYYGPETSEAVADYQRRHNLKVDGIVGPATWNTMF